MLDRSVGGATPTTVAHNETAFCGDCTEHDPERKLDRGIVRAVWRTRAAIADALALRSPMVLRCIDDYLRGERYPLSALKHLEAHHAATAAKG